MIVPVIISMALAALAASKGRGKGGMAAPVRGRITSRYGWRVHPVTGARKLHKGLDVGVPTGTPVVAAGAGTVSKVAHDAVSGNYVKIDHGKGVVTAYMHLERVDVHLQQRVGAGQRIGLSGATGRVTGPHLHFEVRVGDGWADPLDIIPESAFTR